MPQRARGRHQCAAASRAASRHSSSARAKPGHPIEIISGMEEARLIYPGVAHNLPNEPGRRLVVDIGGGSTEIIIGERLRAARAREPADRLRVAEPALFRRRPALRQAHRARAAGGAPGAGADPGGVPAPRLGARRGQLRHRACDRRGIRELDPTASGITPAASTAAVDSASRRTHARARAGAVTEERRPVFPGGVVILTEIFARSASSRCASSRARCAMACCTTWSAA